MLPAGPLMVEHRLIERMIKLMSLELSKIAKGGKVNADFLDDAIDFLKTYADKCHHGKEEDFLFKALAKKSISEGHKKTMDELLQEHVFARRIVTAFAESKNKYAHNDKAALKDIIGAIETLVELYSQHIEKEDKHFFLPVMKYLSKQEQAKMLDDFRCFDQNFIHCVYKSNVEKWESRKG